MNGNCGGLKYCNVLTIFLLLITSGAHSQEMNGGRDTELPGISFVGTWTFQGVGSLRLQYENGHICYKTSELCYDYDASLSFRQVGSPFYGRKIYIDTFYTAGGSVWLSGFSGGGVKVYVDSSLLPLEDMQRDIYFEHSPDYWDGEK